METGLNINANKTKQVVMSSNEHAGQNHKIITNNESFETVEEFRYLIATLTNQNSIHVEINTLRTRSFKLFKRPFPRFLTVLTL